MNTESIVISIARCNGQDYVHALSPAAARRGAEQHFAFGDPAESQYAVSNVWAAAPQDAGWQIIELAVDTIVIEVDLKISTADSTNHVIWTCPFCRKSCSDDWRPDDCLPILLMCGCESRSKYLLGRSLMTSALRERVEQ